MVSNDRWKIARRAGSGALGAVGLAFVATDLRLWRLIPYGGSRVALVLIVVAVGALLGAAKLRAVVWAGLGLVALLWLVVALTPVDRALAEGVPRADAVAPADLVYVLASSVQENGTMSAEALNRLTHGLELVKQGLAPRLVVGELPPPRAHYADAARALMANLGIDAELLSVGPVEITHDEGVLLGALCRQRGWRRIIVVTSPLHSRRAAAVFEHEGLAVVSAPAPEQRFDLESDTPDDRVLAFAYIVHERLGMWVYARRGWL